MIRLIVMYNLPPDTDENEYLNWRLNEHQAANASHEGVRRTDFARTIRTWNTADDEQPQYRFVTTAEWDDWESFEKAFYTPELQANMKENLAKLDNPLYLITEILTETKPD